MTKAEGIRFKTKQTSPPPPSSNSSACHAAPSGQPKTSSAGQVYRPWGNTIPKLTLPTYFHFQSKPEKFHISKPTKSSVHICSCSSLSTWFHSMSVHLWFGAPWLATVFLCLSSASATWLQPFLWEYKPQWPFFWLSPGCLPFVCSLDTGHDCILWKSIFVPPTMLLTPVVGCLLSLCQSSYHNHNQTLGMSTNFYLLSIPQLLTYT